MGQPTIISLFCWIFIQRHVIENNNLLWQIFSCVQRVCCVCERIAGIKKWWWDIIQLDFGCFRFHYRWPNWIWITILPDNNTTQSITIQQKTQPNSISMKIWCTHAVTRVTSYKLRVSVRVIHLFFVFFVCVSWSNREKKKNKPTNDCCS